MSKTRRGEERKGAEPEMTPLRSGKSNAEVAKWNDRSEQAIKLKRWKNGDLIHLLNVRP
jgi:hypothetical protein